MNRAYRYLKLSLKKTWRMELFLILSLFLVCMLITMILSAASPLRDFAWMKSRADITLQMECSEQEINEIYAAENLVGEISDGWHIHNQELANGNKVQYATEIDYGAATVLKVPLRKGRWFQSGKGSQVIVSAKLSNIYELDKTYRFALSHTTIGEDGIPVQIEREFESKVVGYLDSGNYTIGRPDGVQSSSALMGMFANQNVMMFCNETVVRTTLTSAGGKPVVTINGLIRLTDRAVQIWKDMGLLQHGDADWHGGRFYSLAGTLQSYKENNKPLMSLYVYSLIGIFGIALISVMTNAVAGSEKQKRLRAVSVLCGMRQKSILCAELCKRALSLAITLLLSLFVMLLVYNFMLLGEGVRLMSPQTFLFGALAIVIISAVILVCAGISVVKLKPIKILCRD